MTKFFLLQKTSTSIERYFTFKYLKQRFFFRNLVCMSKRKRSKKYINLNFFASRSFLRVELTFVVVRLLMKKMIVRVVTFFSLKFQSFIFSFKFVCILAILMNWIFFWYSSHVSSYVEVVETTYVENDWSTKFLTMRVER